MLKLKLELVIVDPTNPDLWLNTGARVFDMKSLSACVDAIYAGVFGRHSRARFYFSGEARVNYQWKKVLLPVFRKHNTGRLELNLDVLICTKQSVNQH